LAGTKADAGGRKLDGWPRTRWPGAFWEVVVETVMLVCAVFASLTLGVLVSYGLCQGMFRVFRVHSISAARGRMKTAALPLVEG
jgi:hypothetical protein